MCFWWGHSVGVEVGTGVSPLFLPGWEIRVGPWGNSRMFLFVCKPDQSVTLPLIRSPSCSGDFLLSLCQSPSWLQGLGWLAFSPLFPSVDSPLRANSPSTLPCTPHPKSGKLSPLSPSGLPLFLCHAGSHSLVCNSELQTL